MVSKKHPRGLYILFLTEMWDRVGYYGVLSVLILYLSKRFLFSDQSSYALFGIYTTFAFATPILGGILADRFIGYQKAIIFGISMIILGNVLLLFQTQHFLFLGLSAIIAGIGLFKANNATLLGRLYSQDDIRKESGFTIFYMGMNAGAILGPIIFGFISLHYGFRVSFIINIIGFSLSLALFSLNYRYFKPYSTVNSSEKKIIDFIKNHSLLLISAALCLVLVYSFFNYPYVFKEVMWVTFILTLAFVLYLAYKQTQPYRSHIILLLILNIFVMFYFSSSLQISSSLMLFISRHVDKTIFGLQIPSGAFASLDPLFIIIIAPFIAPLWTHLEKVHHSPSIIKRVFLGLIFGAISFGIFALSTQVSFWHGMNLPLIFIIAGNLFLGIGELCISPAMLASVTYLLPANLRGTFIGIYFLFSAFSAYIASILAKLSAMPTKGTSISNGHDVYFSAFLKTGAISLTAAIIFFLLIPVLQKLFHPDSTLKGVS